MSSNRNAEVDTVRGLALFGICVVNVPFLAMPFSAITMPPEALGDKVAATVVEVLFQGKFFVLFSFLFGWGFAVQMASAARREIDFKSAYRRRMIALLIIGMAHALLVFDGDILVLYALLGLTLPLIRDLPSRKLLQIFVSLVVLSGFALMILAIGLEEVAANGPGQSEVSGYLGNWFDSVRQRCMNWPGTFLFILLFNGPMALACFCAGLAAYRGRFFEPGASSYATVKRQIPWLCALGLLLNLFYSASVSGKIENQWISLLGFSGLAIGGPCLACVYLIAAVELARRNLFQHSTVAAGRMSLTAYIFEGILAGLIFNGYGLGYYGQVGLLACFGIATAIFIVIHIFCVLWLRRFRQGPFEAMLRKLAHRSH